MGPRNAYEWMRCFYRHFLDFFFELMKPSLKHVIQLEPIRAKRQLLAGQAHQSGPMSTACSSSGSCNNSLRHVHVHAMSCYGQLAR